MLDRVWSELRANVYDPFAAWLATHAERGTVRVDDPEATAAVWLAPLTYPPILNALIGHAPGMSMPRATAQHGFITPSSPLTGQNC